MKFEYPTTAATPVAADALAVADAPGFELPSPDGGDKVDLLALTRLPGIGPKRCMTLLQTFGSARDALVAPVAQWAQAVGLRVAQEARQEPLDRRWAEAQLRHVERLGGCMITVADADYPALLREIPVPPPVLFSLGVPVWAGACVAVVGSRRATQYGQRMARKLSRELTELGICVVSGMARGVDSAAHQGALEGGGKTIAVPGCGADVVFPRENRALYREILEGGAVLSEFPMGEQPTSGSFPRRNRIISGLSLGVVVIEAPERSGALITARYAAEQNRQVFAVPGDALSRRSTGCHRLIRDGARLVETVDDVLEELQYLLPETSKAGAEADGGGSQVAISLDSKESAVLELIGAGDCHVDELVHQTGLAAAQVLDVLLRLELAGLVEQLTGKRFCRRLG